MNMAVNPPSEDGNIEAQIQKKGLTAPRITPDRIQDMMDTLTFKTHHFEGTNITVAIALLPNGFQVGIGKSGSVSSANFDAEIGRNVAISAAMTDARNELWKLEGYVLRKQLDDWEKPGELQP